MVVVVPLMLLLLMLSWWRWRWWWQIAITQLIADVANAAISFESHNLITNKSEWKYIRNEIQF